jgi:2-keto-4-pentenoate hydratase/2-oxohepta-3-ene-1,7-dioic acid hydratase in catechol pathway
VLTQRPGKIVAVGRNYAEHAAELGLAVAASPRIFFKPPSAVVGDGEPIVLPKQSQLVEHEGELGVVIGRAVRNAGPDDVLDSVAGYCCANDVTARDIQKADGLPDYAKAFDSFLPLGPMMTAEGVDVDALRVECLVNGDLRQSALTTEMLTPIRELLAYVTAAMTLEPGDVVLTGTPAGTGQLVAGDVVTVRISGVGEITNPVVESDLEPHQS